MHYFSMLRILACLGVLFCFSDSMFHPANSLREKQASQRGTESKNTKNEKEATLSVNAFQDDLQELLIRIPRRPDVSDIYLKHGLY